MNKAISFLLKASLILGCCVSVPASATIVLSFDKSNYLAPFGDTFEVAVRISGLGDMVAPSLGTFQLSVIYDPVLVHATMVEFGDPVLGNQLALQGVDPLIQTADLTTPGQASLLVISFNDALVLDSLQRGSFTLATLTFNSGSNNLSQLEFAGVTLGDSNGDPFLENQIQLGIATINGPIPESSTYLMLMIGLVLVVASKRMVGPQI